MPGWAYVLIPHIHPGVQSCWEDCTGSLEPTFHHPSALTSPPGLRLTRTGPRLASPSRDHKEQQLNHAGSSSLSEVAVWPQAVRGQVASASSLSCSYALVLFYDPAYLTSSLQASPRARAKEEGKASPSFNTAPSPGRCGLVSWASSRKAKGCWFHSRLGHMPGLCVHSLVGVPTKGSQLMFLSLSKIK